MKMSRDQLKSLVKECLLEILNEGLGNVSQAPSQFQPPPQRQLNGVSESRSRQRPFDSRLDTPLNGGRAPTSALKNAIKESAGGNPLMESIFADTARTTLASQISHGDVGTPPPGSSHSGRGGPVQQEQFSGDPEQIFEGASRWASLAFMDGPGKKTA